MNEPHPSKQSTLEVLAVPQSSATLPTSVARGLHTRRYRMGRTVAALILREMSTTFGRSPGGYIWAILEPVLALAFMVFVFSFFMRVPPLGNSFPLFYATGFLPFMAFNDTANKIATSVRYSRPLLEYPVITYLDAMVARLILTIFTHVVVGFIIVSAIILIDDTRATIVPAGIVYSIAMIAAAGFGVGTINCYLMTAFPVWERLWSVATRPLMLISGTFFTYHTLPSFAQDILWYNPLMHIVGELRTGIYPGYWSDYISLSYVLGVSLGLTVLGLLLLNRHHKKMMNEM